MQSVVLLYDVLKALGCPYVPEVMGEIGSVAELLDFVIAEQARQSELRGHIFELFSRGSFLWYHPRSKVEVVVRQECDAIINVNLDNVDWLFLRLPLRPYFQASFMNAQCDSWQVNLRDPVLPWYKKLLWQARNASVIGAVTPRLQNYLPR